MVLIWFDTPGRIPEKYARELVDLVHRNQSKALVSGRVGHGLGDYRTLGDMEIPHVNVEGLWESVDVTNDSWGYAWYDENWKSPKEILERLISTVATGGTYMLNVGPDGKGNIPGFAVRSLEASGKWLSAYPQVVYGAGPSPWLHALPWGDVTVNGDKLYLSIYDYPRNGKLYLPGLQNDIVSARLLKAADLPYSGENGGFVLDLPIQQPDDFISVIELTIDGAPLVDHTPALDPFITTELTTHFADAIHCKIEEKRWMEKFGEWKVQQVIRDWKEGSKATWEIKVFQPGVYFVELSYAGSGRLAWSVASGEGAFVQNQQNSSHIYSTYPMGWMQFENPGTHKISVSLVEGDPDTSELSGIRFTPISFGQP
jgi:alpha-L-fucosidase